MSTSGRDRWATQRRRRARPRGRGVARLLWVLGLVGAALIWTAASAGPSEDLEDLLWDLQIVPLEGDPPPFTLADLDGRRHSLGDLKGQAGLLYFWATW